jgi:hypothetical protein
VIKVKFRAAALIGACTLTCALGGEVSAHVADYTLTGTVDGVFTGAGGPTPFSNVQASLLAVADTTTLDVKPGANFFQLSGATFSLSGLATETLDVGANAAFGVGTGVNTGKAAFGTFSGGAFTPSVVMASPLFGGWAGTSGIGPFGLTSVKFSDGYPVTISSLVSGDVIEIETFRDPIFSASVPEPGTWAVMLIGFGIAGAALRRRRQATAGLLNPR